MTAPVTVEIVYATPDKQHLQSFDVPEGTTARDAVVMAGLDQVFPQLDVATAPLGIFNRRLKQPEKYPLKAGDRVEIYRPLTRDPKKRRRDKASRD